MKLPKTSSLIVEAKAKCLKIGKMVKADVRELWKTMNSWVYNGFYTTYERMGITFDKVYYESETYLLGKKLVEEGLKIRNTYKESRWINLV